MENTAIDTIQNISDITLLMTYVKQKIHTNVFLNYVKQGLKFNLKNNEPKYIY